MRITFQDSLDSLWRFKEETNQLILPKIATVIYRPRVLGFH